jgi:acetylglutamate kinase
MAILKLIKIGGEIIDHPDQLEVFIEQLAALKEHILLVHGGGKLATRLAEQMHVPVQMIAGRRITDAQTLEIITMVYAGKINKQIVVEFQKHQCNAIGFTGADGNTIISRKRAIDTIDYGFVGDIEKVNTDVLLQLLESKITPVFCAITHDQKGQLLNTNADTVASELAIALSQHYEVELYYCFGKKGVLKDISDDTSVIAEINPLSYKKLKNDGAIADGMLPKLDNCFHALANGVGKIYIGKPEILYKTESQYTTLKNS